MFMPSVKSFIILKLLRGFLFFFFVDRDLIIALTIPVIVLAEICNRKIKWENICCVKTE